MHWGRVNTSEGGFVKEAALGKGRSSLSVIRRIPLPLSFSQKARLPTLWSQPVEGRRQRLGTEPEAWLGPGG